VIDGSPESILGVAAGQLPLSAVKIKGNRKMAIALLRPA
jgi:hypothetical protein